MYFPTADIETSVFFPPLVSFVVSFFTSMGGISGAFLLLPFQVSVLGYVAPSVSATNQLYNIVAIPSGVWRFIHEDRMLWPLAFFVIMGTLPGVLLGAVIRVQYLPDAEHFTFFVGLVLLYMGLRMLRACLQGKRKKQAGQNTSSMKGKSTVKTPSHDRSSHDVHAVSEVHWTTHHVFYTFEGEQFSFSTYATMSLCLVVGIIGGAYGIGGGAIIAPFLVSVFGLPVYTVAGAALLGTFATSIAGVTFYLAIAPWYPHLSVAPDWLLGILLGLGGMAGMYCGARCQRFVPCSLIRWGLAFVLLGTALNYLI